MAAVSDERGFFARAHQCTDVMNRTGFADRDFLECQPHFWFEPDGCPPTHNCDIAADECGFYRLNMLIKIICALSHVPIPLMLFAK